MTNKERSQFTTHLLRIAACVGGFLWLALVWGAIKVLSMPDTERHSHSIGKRKLRMVDRLALVAFVAAFVWGISRDTPSSAVVGLGLGFGSLLSAWAYDRFAQRRHADHGPSDTDKVMV
jgi:hypothetical protein